MKILILNSSDIVGGAARAAYRLHRGLRDTGVVSWMAVQKKTVDDFFVVGPVNFYEKILSASAGTLNILPLKFFYRSTVNFSTQWVPDQLLNKIDKYKPDIVNLHWINRGFMKIGTIGRIKQPIIWTLHDMWPFTGGCHYSMDCDSFKNECGHCPQLKSHKKFDLSYILFKIKSLSWRNKKIVVVSPSKWLAEKAKKSYLFRNFRIEAIPNGLNLDLYKPIEKKVARNILNLPLKEKLILLITSSVPEEGRKGGKYVKLLIGKLQSKKMQKVNFLVVGSYRPDSKDRIWKQVFFTGLLRDDYALSLVFSAADIYVSLSQTENLPNTIMESMACGTPCVAFAVGGIPEMIEHKENGYLARPFEIDDIEAGINFILENPLRYQELVAKARDKVLKNYNYKLQAERYLSLFSDLLKS